MNLGIRLNHAFRGLTLCLPLSGYLPALTSNHLSAPAFVWPPVGDITYFAAGAAATLVGIIGSAAKLLKRRSQKDNAYWAGCAVSGTLLCLYIVLLFTRVSCTSTPSDGTQCRAIGTQRTLSAERCDPKDSNKDLLRCGGLEDGDIETIWTPASVDRSRISLLITYTLMLGVMNFTTATKSGRTQSKRSASANIEEV